jgi:hypothetical protein
MHGDEERVVTAYGDWLQRNGWTATREAGFVDIYAERGPEKLCAEAKARTVSIGWTWTLCMVSFLGGCKTLRLARYAVVAAAAALQATLRVPFGCATASTSASTK